MGLDELERRVGQNVGDVAQRLHRLTVTLEQRVKILTPMARGEAEILGEAPRVGVIRPLRAVVPFAERAGRVAGGLKDLGNRAFVEIEPLATG